MYKKYKPTGRRQPFNFQINQSVIAAPDPLLPGYPLPQCIICPSDKPTAEPSLQERYEKRRLRMLSERQRRNYQRVQQIEMAIMKEEVIKSVAKLFNSDNFLYQLKDLNRTVKNKQLERRLISRLIDAPSLSHFDGSSHNNINTNRDNRNSTTVKDAPPSAGSNTMDLTSTDIDGIGSISMDQFSGYTSTASISISVPIMLPPIFTNNNNNNNTNSNNSNNSNNNNNNIYNIYNNNNNNSNTNNILPTITEMNGTTATDQITTTNNSSQLGTPTPSVVNHQQQHYHEHEHEHDHHHHRSSQSPLSIRRMSVTGVNRQLNKHAAGTGRQKKKTQSNQKVEEEPDFLKEYPLLETLATSLNKWIKDRWPADETKGTTSSTEQKDFIQLFRECGVSAARISERSLMRPIVNAVADIQPPGDLLQSLRKNMRDLVIEDPAVVRKQLQKERFGGGGLDTDGLLDPRPSERQVIDGSLPNDRVVGSVDRMINRMLGYTQVDQRATKQWLDKIQDKRFQEMLINSILCRGYIKPVKCGAASSRSGSLSVKSFQSLQQTSLNGKK